MDKKLMGYGVLVLVVGLLFGGLLFEREGSSEKNVRKITVSGDGLAYASPDQASVFLSVRTESLTADQARQQNADLMEKVRTALAGFGLADKDIETVSYSVNPKYEWNEGKHRSELVGYEAFQQLKVKTMDLDKIGAIIDATVGAGANQVDNIQFELSDQKKKQVSDEVLAGAAKKAKEKAGILASSLNAKLGKALEISEANYFYQPRFVNYAMEKSAAPVGAATEINPQEVQVSVNINVVFELR